MMRLKRKLIAVMVGLVLATGALAEPQKGGGKRPPKDRPIVVVQPKGEKPPPPRNENRGGKQKGDKRGRP
ncbi:MAG: hypothetical protein ACRD8U_15825 [Pyrinomonadaceae bacterium]